MFNKSYELSLTVDYVSHWGLIDAVRELIQNALDSDSPFKYEFKNGPDDTTTLMLRSEHSSLSSRSLLLGSTSKSEAVDKIGSFGEGYKIALLVLTRLNQGVEVWNGNKLWTTDFKFSRTFDTDILVINESPMPFKHTGLDFCVPNLQPSDVTAICESCIHMKDNVGQIISTSYGDILLDIPGKLYVGGLLICDTELKYGYNIKPEFINLERDRKTVDSWDLRNMSKQMWYESARVDAVAEMIRDEVPDVAYAEYGSPEMVKEACYNLFKADNPGKLVATSPEDLRDKVAKGLTKYVYTGASYGSVIRSSSSYRLGLQVVKSEKSPHEELTDWFKDAKYHMRADVKKSFEQLLKASKNWKL